MVERAISTASSGPRTRGPQRVLLAGAFALASLALLAAGASGAPTVAILSPTDGATINSGTVEIAVDIQNITMNGSAIGQAAVAGEGHYHIYLDDLWLRAEVDSTTFLSNVGAGLHTLRIELSENDHTEIGVNDSVLLTVLPGAPRVMIVSPSGPSDWGSSSAELSLSVGNFTLNSAAMGGAPVAGEGHYRVSVDGAFVFAGTSLTLNVSSLRIGRENVIHVELVGNDGAPLSPPAYDEVRLTPTPGVPELAIAPSVSGALVNASSLKVPLLISNFTLNGAAIGAAPAAGVGHYRVVLDGTSLGPFADNPVLLADLPEGRHVLAVELRANDLSELSPRVVSWLEFTVVPGAPAVTITSPAPSAAVNASSVEVALSIANFSLSSAHMGQAPVSREGHWHVFVDGLLVGMGADPTALVSDLSEGSHIIVVELTQNDHTALAWAPFDTVRITVLAAAPRLTITAPADGTSIGSSSVALTFTVSNFVLDASAVGQPAVAGRGHWHLFVDGQYRGYGTGLTATATRLLPGVHSIVVELYDNDHSDLAWPVFDQIAVTVLPGSPYVAFVSPTPASSLPLNFTLLRVTVANFSVVDKPDQTPVAGEGHWHIFVDSVFYGMAYEPKFVVEGLTPGEHTIRAVLVGNDHLFLNPSVVDDVTVTVGGLRPLIAITSPANGTFVYSDSATITVQPTNFTFAPGKISQLPVMGEGHYHVFLDGAYVTFVADTSYTLTGLAVGDHEVTVQLFNNDHTALDIRVVSSVVLRVSGEPRLTITSPANGAITSETTLTLQVAVANFTLEPVPTTAIANAPGHGHYHIEVDGVFHSMATGPSATIANLHLGPHTIRVFLVNNDHTNIGTTNSSATVIVTIVEPAAPPVESFPTGLLLIGIIGAVAAGAVGFFVVRARKKE